MSWCFAIVNRRLAEIYFEKTRGRIKIIGHCYIDREDYQTKQEQRWIEEDIERYRFVYRKGKYKAASSTFKDGDLVEVDAEKGIVRKL